jgi:hypothetical protein
MLFLWFRQLFHPEWPDYLFSFFRKSGREGLGVENMSDPAASERNKQPDSKSPGQPQSRAGVFHGNE